jgi:hypothetical protein
MRAEDKIRPTSLRNLESALYVRLIDEDPLVAGFMRIVVRETVDEGEFGEDPAQIVPHAIDDTLDLLVRLLRKCGL